MTTAKPVRLDKLLANLGYGSRRMIAGFVRNQEVTLNGEPVASADIKVTPDAHLVEALRIGGQPLDPLPGVVIVMHKPLGVTCSHRDQGPLVYDLLPERMHIRTPQISTVGRLDKETSGLLLLTDDGALLHRLISPKSKLPKRYRVSLERPLRGDEAEVFAAGTLLLDGEDKPLAPAGFEIAPESTDAAPVVFATVTEGRYHQVRRMFAALGNHVTALHRDQFGGLALPEDLAPGKWRVASEADMAAISAQTSRSDPDAV